MDKGNKSLQKRIDGFTEFLDYRLAEFRQTVKDISYTESIKYQYLGAIRELEIIKQILVNDKIIKKEEKVNEENQRNHSGR